MKYITQYEIKEIFQKERFIFLDFLEREIKPDFVKDYEYNGQLKKNIKHYNIEKIIKNLFFKVKKHKSGETLISSLFLKFIQQIKNQNIRFSKETNQMLDNFPKPKYKRKSWKRYVILKDEIKSLKRAKRRVRKKYYGKVLKEKLQNIEEELNAKQIRLRELAEKLK